MNTRPGTLRRRRASIYMVLALLLVGTLMSCNALFPPPRQGWSKSFGPVVPHDTFPGDCAVCHEGTTWTKIKKDFTYDHNRLTKFELRGAHQKAQCLMCHNDRGPALTFAAKGCAGCHIDVHRTKLGQLCSDCHNEQSWRPLEQIAKHNRTRFPLVGAHAGTACFSCHKNAQVGNFEGTDTTCVTCHTKDLAKAISPDHKAQGWTSDCQKCHTPVGWKPAQFAHPSSFPLTAGHAGVACSTCHTGGTFKGLSTSCSSCHQQLFATTTDPNHTLAGFSSSCQTCHSTNTWQNAKFAHTANFPLTGGHGGINCSTCHANNIFTGKSADCVSCHLANYQATKNPNHVTIGFGTDCKTCHGTNQWKGAKFNHPASFPLTNGHGGLTCSNCHKNGVYTGLTNSCVACHLDKYQATKNPVHATSGFGTSCKDCHSTSTWLDAKFNHPATFPLTAGHAGRLSQDCHSGGVYTGLSTTCVSCHQAKYDATTTPKHSTAGFGTDCKTCHTTTVWTGATFTHKSTFPLTAGHAGLACTACHANNVFTGLTTSCVACHLDNYQATKNPNHTTSGYGTGCASCHTTTTWLTSTFKHNQFPITGTHRFTCVTCHTDTSNQAVFTCIDCHTHSKANTDPHHSGVRNYVWQSNACYSCHSGGKANTAAVSPAAAKSAAKKAVKK